MMVTTVPSLHYEFTIAGDSSTLHCVALVLFFCVWILGRPDQNWEMSMSSLGVGDDICTVDNSIDILRAPCRE